MLGAIAAGVALVAAGDAAARGPVRPATAAETHAIAVAIRQPRFTCFDGRVARAGGWGALRLAGGAGCPELPYAIIVRADGDAGWRELRRFWSRRAACAARRPRLPVRIRAGLLGCPARAPARRR